LNWNARTAAKSDKYEAIIRRHFAEGDEAAARAARPALLHMGELLWEAYVQFESDDKFVAWVRRHFPTLQIKKAREAMQMAMAAGYRPPPKATEGE
jgi:hypothetical protein